MSGATVGARLRCSISVLPVRLPSLLPPRPDPSLPEQGLPGAESGAAFRPGQDRRDAPGRRPPSSIPPVGSVRSRLRLGVPATLSPQVRGFASRPGVLLPSRRPHRSPNGHGTRFIRTVLGCARPPTARRPLHEHPGWLNGRDTPYDPSTEPDFVVPPSVGVVAKQ